MNWIDLWAKVRDFAASKHKDAYMDTYKHDRLCNNCKTWISEVGGAASVYDEGDYQFMSCKKCGYNSRWNMTEMVPIYDPLPDPQTGYTLSQQERDAIGAEYLEKVACNLINNFEIHGEHYQEYIRAYDFIYSEATKLRGGE